MKIVEKIEVPDFVSLYAGAYGSHRPLIWAILNKTIGSVAEVGCGLYSTKMIDDFCNEHGRKFKSYESDQIWSSKAQIQYGERIVSGYDSIEPDDEVLFIDCAPGEKRKELIEKFKDKCKIIIAHDTEEGAEYVYGMKNILSSFKYHVWYKPPQAPHTTAVSNFINIEEWF